MTVKQLIDLLAQHNPEADVVLFGLNDGEYIAVRGITDINITPCLSRQMDYYTPTDNNTEKKTCILIK